MAWESLRDIPHEFIITIGNDIQPTDLKLFFQYNPERDKDMFLIHYKHLNIVSYQELAVALNQQPSLGQAQKNGWAGIIPQGYTEFKRKFHRFYILNMNKE